jgi:hypothetical protein
LIADPNPEENAAYDVVYHFFNALRAGIESGDWRENHRARFGCKLHQAQMAEVQGRFTHSQDQRPAFFEGDIGNAG